MCMSVFFSNFESYIASIRVIECVNGMIRCGLREIERGI